VASYVGFIWPLTNCNTSWLSSCFILQKTVFFILGAIAEDSLHSSNHSFLFLCGWIRQSPSFGTHFRSPFCIGGRRCNWNWSFRCWCVFILLNLIWLLILNFLRANTSNTAFPWTSGDPAFLPAPTPASFAKLITT
jgi:hypothetical protein